MKRKRTCFAAVFLAFLLVSLPVVSLFPGQTGTEEKKEKKFPKRVVEILKSLDWGFGAKAGWFSLGLGDFKKANRHFEDTYRDSSVYTAEVSGFSGSLSGKIEASAEYDLSNSRKLGFGTGIMFFPGGSFEQSLTSQPTDIDRNYNISSFAVPLELYYKMPLKMKINEKPLILRFTGGLDFIKATVDYEYYRRDTTAAFAAAGIPASTGGGVSRDKVKLKDSALGGHISVGLEYPFSENFSLTLDAGYSIANLDRFTGTYTDGQGGQHDVVLGMAGDNSGNIIPIIYHDTVCPKLPTAGTGPGGYGITIGIKYYPGEEEIPGPEKTCECEVGYAWHGGPAIKIESGRNLDYYPKGDTLLAGDMIAFSVLASDVDILIHKCAEAGTVKSVFHNIADPVAYNWNHKGVGKLLQSTGNTVFYQLPEDMKNDSSESVSIACNISSSRGDTTITGQIVIDIKRGDDNCAAESAPLEVGVKITPVKEAIPSYPVEIVGTCTPNAPRQKAFQGVKGGFKVLSRYCCGGMVLLRAGLRDMDRYILDCSGRECRDPEKVEKVDFPDPLGFAWHDNGAGGSFPFGRKGKQVAYIPPRNVAEITMGCDISNKNVFDDAACTGKIVLQAVDVIVENVPEAEEECAGGFLPLNCDDDNENGIIDKEEKGQVVNENDLLKITLKKTPETGKVKLSAAGGADRIRIWEEPDKKKEVKLPQEYPAGELPKDLYVEGLRVSEEPADIQVTLESEDPQCSDKIRLSVIRVDMDVDADRDKSVHIDKDDTKEDAWERGKGKRGAVILPNCDSDTISSIPDNWPGGDIGGYRSPNSYIDSSSDLEDIGPLWLHKTGLKVLPNDLTLVLSIDKVDGENKYFDKFAANRRVRIFLPGKKDGNNLILKKDDKEIIGPGNPDDKKIGPGRTTVTFMKNPDSAKPEQLDYEIFRGDGLLEFGIEGIKFGSPVSITLEVFINDLSVSKDSVQVRVAPFIALSNKQVVDLSGSRHKYRVYIVNRGALNKNLRDDLRKKYKNMNLFEPPGPLVGDIWFQDHHEIGYTEAPYGRMHVILPLPNRKKGPFEFVLLCMVRDGVGLVADKYPDKSFYDYKYNNQCGGGNFEVMPDGKFGTIVFAKGRQGGHMNPAVISFLKAQEIQPVIDDIDLSWLSIGHIDEVVSFPSSAGKRSLVASPEAAWALMMIARDMGGGQKPLLHQEEGINTVADLLDSIAINVWNFDVLGASNCLLKVKRQLGFTAPVTTPVTRKGLRKLERAGYLEVFDADRQSLEWKITFFDGLNFEIKRRKKGTTKWISDGKGNRLKDFVSDSKIVYINTNWWSGIGAANDEMTFETAPSPDMIELPVLFQLERQSAGFIPYFHNVVNALVDGKTIFAAKPYGPKVLKTTPRDILEDYIEKACGLAGFQNVIFSDDLYYHRKWGSIHCAIQVLRKIPDGKDDKWWYNK